MLGRGGGEEGEGELLVVAGARGRLDLSMPSALLVDHISSTLEEGEAGGRGEGEVGSSFPKRKSAKAIALLEQNSTLAHKTLSFLVGIQPQCHSLSSLQHVASCGRKGTA